MLAGMDAVAVLTMDLVEDAQISVVAHLVVALQWEVLEDSEIL